MRRLKTLMIILILITFSWSAIINNTPDLTGWQRQLKIGPKINGNYFFPYFDESSEQGIFSPGIGALLSCDISNRLALNLAIEYNQVKIGQEPELLNKVIQANVTGKFYVLRGNQINPFVDLGGGLFSFTQDNGRSGMHSAFLINTGVGAEIPLADNINLVPGLDMNTTLKQDIEKSYSKNSTIDDIYFSLSLGVTYDIPLIKTKKQVIEQPKPVEDNWIEIPPQDSLANLKASLNGMEQKLNEYKNTAQEHNRKIQALSILVKNKTELIDSLEKKAESNIEASQRSTSRRLSFTTSNDDVYKQYNQYLDLYNQKNYQEAAGKFSKLLLRHPNHNLASNIAYWAGESYYGLGKYQDALEYFNIVEGYQQSPKHDDALIMAGQTLLKLDKVEKANAIFEELLNKYPDSEYAELAREYLNR